MKKRIFSLALLAIMILSLTAQAICTVSWSPLKTCIFWPGSVF